MSPDQPYLPIFSQDQYNLLISLVQSICQEKEDKVVDLVTSWSFSSRDRLAFPINEVNYTVSDIRMWNQIYDTLYRYRPRTYTGANVKWPVRIPISDMHIKLMTIVTTSIDRSNGDPLSPWSDNKSTLRWISNRVQQGQWTADDQRNLDQLNTSFFTLIAQFSGMWDHETVPVNC